MKLRDFMANSLPRVRGRKKKGPPPNGTAVSITAAAVAVATASASPSPTKQRTADIVSPTSARSAAQDKNGNWFQFGESRFGFWERLVGKDSPVKRLFEAKERQTVCPGDEKTEERIHRDVNEASGVSSTSALGDSDPDDSVEVTSSLTDDSYCQYSVDASSVTEAYPLQHYSDDADCGNLYGSYQGYAESVTSYDSTPGSQRAPRSRSRIRTNPWLPSPRPSPYSVRSFSSPCTSSRSPSPTSSPAPPSSSDNTSPRTSHNSDVKFTRESQLHRHRRHRRHHSEINAADLTRHFVFETHLTDTEQYYSTLDSGIGETVTSPEKKSKHRISSSRKHRVPNSKRKGSERDFQSFHYPRGFNQASKSPSPKLKTRSRSKTKTSLSSSSKGIVVNRDSTFWDSDSSRSPPCVPKGFGSKPNRPSPRFASKDPDSVWDSDSSGTPSYRVQRGESASVALNSGTFLPETVAAGFNSTHLQTSSVLSPCDDICVITSNIEQLAQNISFEYEEGIDENLKSARVSAEQNDRCASLQELFNIDADDRVVLLKHDLREPDDLQEGAALDYSAFVKPLQCGEALRKDWEETQESQLDTTLTEISVPNAAANEIMPTIDVAVQTDFADDEDEENTGSDWLASAESGSDWLVSNGSGSDWLASGGSGCDWLTGEGSGCATEEEEEVGRTEVEEDFSSWEEGGKVWIIPDIMQDSTDTGYSSLSRDGRVNSDCDNNNNDSNSKNTDDSSDSANAAEEKTPSASTGEATRKTISDAREDDAASKKTISKTCTCETSSTGNFDDSGEHCAQRISYTFDFDGVGVNRSDKNHFGHKKGLGSPGRGKDRAEYSSCGEDFSKESTWEEPQYSHVLNTSKPKWQCHTSYDNMVPYPYDVTRFCDITLPRERRFRSISPCHPDSASSSSDLMLAGEKKQRRGPAHSSTPLYDREGTTDDCCSCFSASLTSEISDVTNSGVHYSFLSSHLGKDDLGPRSSRGTTRTMAADLAPSEELPSTGRTLSEVTASLEEKVLFLRQGKHIVNRKIREAREEEVLRQQQKIRFQRLLDIHRKQILLETLQDLRQRLESQSARLQASYSAVLNMQKRYI